MAERPIVDAARPDDLQSSVQSSAARNTSGRPFDPTSGLAMGALAAAATALFYGLAAPSRGCGHSRCWRPCPFSQLHLKSEPKRRRSLHSWPISSAISWPGAARVSRCRSRRCSRRTWRAQSFLRPSWRARPRRRGAGPECSPRWSSRPLKPPFTSRWPENLRTAHGAARPTRKSISCRCCKLRRGSACAA